MKKREKKKHSNKIMDSPLSISLTQHYMLNFFFFIYYEFRADNMLRNQSK